MYILDFLGQGGPSIAGVAVEHRLLCSGELLNARVLAADWRKSDVTRVLSGAPFELFVISRPFDAYPQELSLRFSLNYEIEKAETERASFSRILLPDEEIVEDLCSVLTLLARRLIVPAGKTREQYGNDHPELGSFGRDLPLPLTDVRPTIWKPRQSVMVIKGPDEQEVISFQPPPVEVFPDLLNTFLTKLPSLPEAQRIVRAARLYREAMELIETRPDSTYQLLISMAETISNTALPDFRPTREEILKAERSVLNRALEFGLNDEQAEELALEAARGNPWTKRKFTAFLSGRMKPKDLLRKDTVFQPVEQFCPAPTKFSKALGNIYDLRSGSLHEGKSLPRATRIGIGSMVSARDLPLNPLDAPEVPPVVWFERVVSLAVRRFLLEYVNLPASPFGDPDLSNAAQAPVGG